MSELRPSVGRFVAYFGELGPRWGLPADACRVHAFLYVMDEPVAETELATLLSLDSSALSEALAYLSGYGMATQVQCSNWRTGSDPWEMLIAGLQERGRREFEPALELFQECRTEAAKDRAINRKIVSQLNKMVELVRDLSSLDRRVQKISPRILRSIVGVSGAAARFLESSVGSGRRKGR